MSIYTEINQARIERRKQKKEEDQRMTELKDLNKEKVEKP